MIHDTGGSIPAKSQRDDTPHRWKPYIYTSKALKFHNTNIFFNFH